PKPDGNGALAPSREPIPDAPSGAGPERASPPPVIWLAAPQRLSGARLSADARSVDVDGRTLPLAVVPPIATNQSYIDGSTAEYFSGRPLSLRGSIDAAEADPPHFVARTIFPEDERIEIESPPLEPLA